MDALIITCSISIFAMLCCGGIAYMLIYHIRRLSLYKKASVFCGPPILPFVGNALHFLGNTEDILNKIMKLTSSHPSLFRIWLGPQLMIFTSQPDHVKVTKIGQAYEKVLTSDKMIEKAEVYKFFRPWLGNGLFTAPAMQWRVHRKLIGPTFNLKILQSFVSVFAARAKRMVQKMKIEVNGPDFQIFNYTSLCTLEIICETAMGVATDEKNKSGCAYVEAAEKVLGIGNQRIFKAWLHPDVIFNRTQLGKEHRQCIETLHGFTDAVIQKKKAALLDRNHQRSIISQEGDGECHGLYHVQMIALQPKPHQIRFEILNIVILEDPVFQRKAYLDHLMLLSDDDKKFSDSELRQEVDTMMVAGNDTSSTAICFVMLMLAFHPDVQEKVYQELWKIYGNRDIDERDVTHEDLPLMDYMERVIKETLRFFPIGPFIGRSVMDDFDLGEYTLPKGALLVIEILTIHRSEKYWDDPLKFDPDRFLPQEIVKRHPYCYLPFSAGPRNCIGARFAMMEMKTILATVLRRYVLKKDNIVLMSDIKLKLDTLLKPVKPITLRIEKR